MKLHFLFSAMILMASLLGASACSSPEQCRFDPEGCGGDLGASCRGDGDCWDGNCCTDDGNCGGGMCTLSCRNDRDCPSFMGCEHDICFFLCDFDDDCAVGQSCEHGDTVCEWP